MVVLYPTSVLLFLKIVCSMSTRVDSISNNNLKWTQNKKGKVKHMNISSSSQLLFGLSAQKTAVTVIVFLDCAAQKAQ